MKRNSIFILVMIGLFLAQLTFVQGYPLKINICQQISLNNNLTVTGNSSLNGNVSLICNDNFLVDTNVNFNLTNSSSITPPSAKIMQVVYYDGNLYFLPSNFSEFYNKYETDSMYMNKADFINFKNLTLGDYVARKEYDNWTNSNMTSFYSNLTNITSNLQTNVNDLKDNGFTTTWKWIIGIAIILSLISIILGAKSSLG